MIDIEALSRDQLSEKAWTHRRPSCHANFNNILLNMKRGGLSNSAHISPLRSRLLTKVNGERSADAMGPSLNHKYFRLIKKILFSTYFHTFFLAYLKMLIRYSFNILNFFSE
ncbi:unnamed protein product [Meganyctiphanes norvegica]|uniref:Uncharacterized protein n=1 Tax=Meganyctiphanes norvegica TaxID=48144 RepID=A0AAV2Q4L5_MEGNR